MDNIIERQFRHHSSMFQPRIIERQIFNDFDKIYKKEMKEFDRIHKNFDNFNNISMPIQFIDSVKIKSEIDDDNYNIIVDLKQFNNDENKIKYHINGKKITVYGNSHINDNNYQENISFSQDFLLPQNADTSKIKMIKELNKLIISIPLM
jgi:HSP20 family molecular chaperone IbpA